ncbi:hypothetical protein [Streptomyces kanamyceticus]|uniref:Uncharacterized protein n=1 Tax=Streptomyces kanamyceticus TaxID=1967 RepID=A0A5J6GMF1_STRKN|nr:hypothetical protein [Streptomyces kanamyceticus]QEU95155.1 hypothetical protein CP970_33405 [Streptomyces kanamyceticus]
MRAAAEEASDLDALYSALGRVVVASARMESRLRYNVGWMAGDHDAGWIVFEGQSVEWLVSNGKAILGQITEMKWWPSDHSDRIARAFNDIQDAARMRNLLVHGQWAKSCSGDEICTARPQTAKADQRIFHVYRSRHRKGFEEREIAICDLDDLAQRMLDLAVEIDDAYEDAIDPRRGQARSRQE